MLPGMQVHGISVSEPEDDPGGEWEGIHRDEVPLQGMRECMERENTKWKVTKRRVVAAGILAVVIVLGIISRAAPLGWSVYDKSLGDVLYAAAAYLAFAILLPRMAKELIAALATAACLAVEFLQLTEINAELLTVPVLRWFLGTTFSWHDVGCYLLGVAGTVIGDVFIPWQRFKETADDHPPQS